MPTKVPWWSLVKRTVTLRPVEDLSIHISIKYTPKTSTNCLLHSVLLLELVRVNKMCMYHFKLGKSLEFSCSKITIEFFQGMVRQRCNVRSMFLNTLKYWTVYSSPDPVILLNILIFYEFLFYHIFALQKRSVNISIKQFN